MIKKIIVILITTFTLITNATASSDGDLLLKKNDNKYFTVHLLNDKFNR